MAPVYRTSRTYPTNSSQVGPALGPARAIAKRTIPSNPEAAQRWHAAWHKYKHHLWEEKLPGQLEKQNARARFFPREGNTFPVVVATIKDS